MTICYRAGDETGSWRNGGRGEDMVVYLFSWLEWSAVSQGVAAGLGAGIKQRVGQEKLRGEDLHYPLENGAAGYWVK